MIKSVTEILDEIEQRGLVDDFNRYAAAKPRLPCLIAVKHYYSILPLRFLPTTAAQARRQLEILRNLERDSFWIVPRSKRWNRLTRMYWAFRHSETVQKA